MSVMKTKKMSVVKTMKKISVMKIMRMISAMKTMKKMSVMKAMMKRSMTISGGITAHTSISSTGVTMVWMTITCSCQIIRRQKTRMSILLPIA